MTPKIKFSKKNLKELKKFILKNQESKTIFNFLNLYSVYLYQKDKEFRESINCREENSITLVDGSPISVFLSTKRLRGTDFSKFLINDLDLLKNKNHFFIGLTRRDLDTISNKSLLKRNNLFTYNPPYIKESRFSKEEIKKMVKSINKNKIDCLWIGVGNPKQEILASDLYDEIDVNFIFNVGAALDFIMGKKKEAPKIVQKLGIEWLYRFITDFKHSHKKVFRSFVGLAYLPKTVEIKR